LAVLRLQKPAGAQLPRWAETSRLRVGELVLALARTGRGNLVASSGVISGLMGSWRTWRGGEVDQFIRPDLTLYSGFSGGPLVNARGEVIGMNTSGLHRSGITVPASTISRVAAELLEKGRIERPYLGVAMQAAPLPESLRTKLNLIATEGLLVVHTESEGPAEKAGVLLGDVLLELDGQATADTDDVQRVLRGHKSGEAVPAKLLRGGALVTIHVTLASRPAKSA
jgi:S1-C subfamily serine protease